MMAEAEVKKKWVAVALIEVRVWRCLLLRLPHSAHRSALQLPLTNCVLCVL